MKQDTFNGMKLVSVNVDKMQVFVTANNVEKNDKWRCECKELTDKGIFDKRFI